MADLTRTNTPCSGKFENDLSEKEYDNKVEKLQTTLLYEKYDAVWNGKKYSKKIIPKYLEEHFVKLEKIKTKIEANIVPIKTTKVFNS